MVIYRERVRLMCFTCWLRSGFSHFINMDSLSFTWYLVAAESRISKQSGVQDALQNSEPCRCLKTFEDLSESKCSRTGVEKCRLDRGFTNITSITTCTRKFIDHTCASPSGTASFTLKRLLTLKIVKTNLKSIGYITGWQVCVYSSVP